VPGSLDYRPRDEPDDEPPGIWLGPWSGWMNRAAGLGLLAFGVLDVAYPWVQ
jgi:hypothetical protein